MIGHDESYFIKLNRAELDMMIHFSGLLSPDPIILCDVFEDVSHDQPWLWQMQCARQFQRRGTAGELWIKNSASIC